MAHESALLRRHCVQRQHCPSQSLIRRRRRHAHHRRPQHAVVEHIARLHFADHRAFRLLRRRHILNRVVQMRIERLPHRFNRLQPLLRQRVPQLRANQLESLAIFRAGRARPAPPTRGQTHPAQAAPARSAIPRRDAVPARVLFPPACGNSQSPPAAAASVFCKSCFSASSFSICSAAERIRPQAKLPAQPDSSRHPPQSQRQPRIRPPQNPCLCSLFVRRQENQPPSCSSEKNCAMNATAVITRS